MEIAKVEVQALEIAIQKGVEVQFKELNELELALVGGGSGDIVFV